MLGSRPLLLAVVMTVAMASVGLAQVLVGAPSPARRGNSIDVAVVPTNGGVRVEWHAPSDERGLTGYVVTVVPSGSDLNPQPQVPLRSISAGPHANAVEVPSGLEADCHQLYKVDVAAMTRTGRGASGVSRVFRPSGIVSPGRPPYVVILLDGIGESKPGFTMDPYHPTQGGPPSYCPENITPDGTPTPYAFTPAPNGPQTFFNKWNIWDPTDNANNNRPWEESNSTPRDESTGAETHNYMLDRIAATGAVILPYSYMRAYFVGNANEDPTFVFQAYTRCNSTPFPPGGGPGCADDPGGSPDIRGLASADQSISDDAETLSREVASVRAVWGDSVPVVVVGHSQGGLIAFEAWRLGHLAGVSHEFALDSPINGVCPARVSVNSLPPSVSVNGLPPGIPVTPPECVGPAGYPRFDSRFERDGEYLSMDRSLGEPFRFIGTWGDSVEVSAPLVGGPAYGTGDETLQHELLVRPGQCSAPGQDSGCPEGASGPDHIGKCRIPDSGWLKRDQHFVGKFCPDNITYFNEVLGLVTPVKVPTTLMTKLSPPSGPNSGYAVEVAVMDGQHPSEDPTATGNVTVLLSGQQPIGSAVVTTGHARVMTTPGNPGYASISARYSGDSAHGPSEACVLAGASTTGTPCMSQAHASQPAPARSSTGSATQTCASVPASTPPASSPVSFCVLRRGATADGAGSSLKLWLSVTDRLPYAFPLVATDFQLVDSSGGVVLATEAPGCLDGSTPGATVSPTQVSTLSVPVCFKLRSGEAPASVQWFAGGPVASLR